MAFTDTLLSVGGKALVVFLIGGAVVIVLALIAGIVIWKMKKRKWNIVVGVKLPRANKTIIHEDAKGFYDVVEGAVIIKRKGVKEVPMKPFDVKEYLQGTYLEVIGLSPTDYIPIHPSSYEKVSAKDDEGNEKEHALLKIETDLLKRRTWKNYAERSLKDAFTIKGFLDKHWRAIEIGIIMLFLFVGFAVLKSTGG